MKIACSAVKQTNQRELKWNDYSSQKASKTQQTAVAPDMTCQYLREGMMCIMLLEKKK